MLRLALESTRNFRRSALSKIVKIWPEIVFAFTPGRVRFQPVGDGRALVSLNLSYLEAGSRGGESP